MVSAVVRTEMGGAMGGAPEMGGLCTELAEEKMCLATPRFVRGEWYKGVASVNWQPPRLANLSLAWPHPYIKKQRVWGQHQTLGVISPLHPNAFVFIEQEKSFQKKYIPLKIGSSYDRFCGACPEKWRV